MSEEMDDSPEDQGSIDFDQLFAQLPDYMKAEVMKKDQAERYSAIMAAANERREQLKHIQQIEEAERRLTGNINNIYNSKDWPTHLPRF